MKRIVVLGAGRFSWKQLGEALRQRCPSGKIPLGSLLDSHVEQGSNRSGFVLSQPGRDFMRVSINKSWAPSRMIAEMTAWDSKVIF